MGKSERKKKPLLMKLLKILFRVFIFGLRCVCCETLAPLLLCFILFYSSQMMRLKVEALRWQKLATWLELATLWQPIETKNPINKGFAGYFVVPRPRIELGTKL